MMAGMDRADGFRARVARATGLVRNLRALWRRVGAAGVMELVASRALPRALSYTRMLLVETAVDRGALHPELEPRRLRAPDAGVLELHAALAASGEPEVPAFTEGDLRERFAAGYELWLFHVDGHVAHALWWGAPHVRFGRLTVPIEDGDRVTEAAVTVPGLRRKGLHRRALEHVHAVAHEEGVSRILSAVNGFQRGLLATAGSDADVTVHAQLELLTVAARTWVRITPETDAGRRFFERAGLPLQRWMRSPADGGFDEAARSRRAGSYLDRRMAAAKRNEHLKLLGRWLPDLRSATVLKTDLWEEGVAGDELLFELARRSEHAYGIDVAQSVVESAKGADRRNGNTSLLRSDLRSLPLEDASIDAVVSTSTIDHLPPLERAAALGELRRVLRPRGVLVITGDNEANVGDRLLKLSARLGLLPFPLDDSVSLAGLQRLASDAGFECLDSAYIVHGPRVLTTVSVRLVRLLGGGDRAVDRLLAGYARLGRRAPSRMGAFVAVRAVAP